MMKRNTPKGRRPPMNRAPEPFNRAGGPRPLGLLGSGPGSSATNGSANRGLGGAGPLMTEHLQIHDLDLELALLKRKREIIEQQQQMLVTERFNRPSPFEYNQLPSSSYNRPQFDEPKLNPPRNFPQFYDRPLPQFDNFNRQQGMKRQADDDGWRNTSPPKRFGGLHKEKPKSSSLNRLSQPSRRPPPSQRSDSFSRSMNTTGQRHVSRSFSQPTPLMGKNWPKPKQSPKGRSDFTPRKVTKPKTTSAPNKLDSYSPSERRNLIDQASDLVKQTNEQDLVLLPDQPMSRQISGRLELALGTIFKEVRSEGGDSQSFGMHALRVMKQGIRERIRTAMFGKVVGSAVDIVKAYRTKYPKETDKELFDRAMEAEKSKTRNPVKHITAENPEKYFKTNMNKLLNTKLSEMFDKLQKLYEEMANNKSLPQIINDIWNEEKNKLESITDEDKPVENADGKAEGDANENVQKDTTQDEQKDDSKTDSQKENNDEPKQNDESKSNDDSKPNEESTPNDELKLNDESEKNDEPKQNETSNEELKADSKGPNWDTNEGRRANYYNRLIGILLHHRLPLMLPKFKDQIINLLNIDEEYKATKAALIMQTNEKAEIYQKQVKEHQSGNEPKPTAEKASTSATPQGKLPPRMLPYYVKIFGRPYLPKRKLMQAFLDQFHPSSIKKHREVHNLLFVGFSNKEDFDNILAANQTVIGNSTIEVKVSEKIKGTVESTPAKPDDDVTIVEDSEANKSDGAITTELDDQINDLLTSIREEEEKNSEIMDPVSDALDIIEKDNQKERDDEAARQSAIEDSEKEEKAEESKTEEPMENEEVKENGNEKEAAKSAEIEALQGEEKASGRATPTKASRLATTTPSTIRTRRASKLAQNN